jgi:hypothetical protein
MISRADELRNQARASGTDDYPPLTGKLVTAALVGLLVAAQHIQHVKEVAETDPMEDYEPLVWVLTIATGIVVAFVGAIIRGLAKRRLPGLSRVGAGIVWSPVAAVGWILLAKAMF